MDRAATLFAGLLLLRDGRIPPRIQQEFPVAFDAGDRRWNGFDDCPTEGANAGSNFINREWMRVGIADDASSAYVLAAGLELRFDQNHRFDERSRRARHGRKHERRRDKSHID